MQGLLPGSVSKYCLQHSPVPVIVVRPTSKRLRKKKKRQLETGRSLYSNMLEQAQSAGGSHVYDKASGGLSTRATEQEAEAVARAIGPPKRGILKGTYGGSLARVTSAKSDITSDEDSPERNFALPIGYLSTENAVRADLALKSPSIAALEENWDDDDVTPQPPKSPRHGPKHEYSAVDDAVSDTEDSYLGVPTIVEERRPSVRETTPWLANILRDKPPPRRAPSKGRSPGR